MIVSLEEHVFQSLNNAKDNGFDFTNHRSDEQLNEVADDLVANDKLLENVSTETLIPIIKQWQNRT